MSNVWSYDLLVKPRATLSADDRNAILAVAERLGYSVRNPDSNQIHVYRYDVENGEFLSVDTEDFGVAARQLDKPGTHIDMWKGEFDFSLAFDFTSEGCRWTAERFELDDSPVYGLFSISVYDVQFRESRARLQIAGDVYQMYCEFATMLNAEYGYSYDENMLEMYFPHQFHTHDDARLRRLPSVLFWLNYFPDDYFSRIGNRRFIELGATISPLASGNLVSFFQHPWNVDLRKLRMLNDEWRKLTKR